MARRRCRPARKALIRIDGIGNFPRVASCVAAISPSVAAGKSASASALPMNGSSVATDSIAINMKKRPDIASGCRQKVWMPSLTQVRPARAGTMLSCMASDRSGKRPGGWIYKVSGCAGSCRSTCSKWRGSWAVSTAASRGRYKSHSREIQKRRAPARRNAGSSIRSCSVRGRTIW